MAFSGIAFSRRAVVAHHVRKQLGETSPSVLPPWDSYVWDDQPPVASGSSVDPAQAGAYIANPLAGQRTAFSKLFSSHPPMEDRVARLRTGAWQA